MDRLRNRQNLPETEQNIYQYRQTLLTFFSKIEKNVSILEKFAQFESESRLFLKFLPEKYFKIPVPIIFEKKLFGRIFQLKK